MQFCLVQNSGLSSAPTFSFCRNVSLFVGVLIFIFKDAASSLHFFIFDTREICRFFSLEGDFFYFIVCLYQNTFSTVVSDLMSVLKF